MSHPTVPEPEATALPPAAASEVLLRRMEELLASVIADLAGLDADLQSDPRYPPPPAAGHRP